MRKVRGDVNLADIFSKYLPSKDKVRQLVKLFGCECRAGRSTAAPLLRPKESGEGQSGPLSARYLPMFSTDCHPFPDIEAHHPELSHTTLGTSLAEARPVSTYSCVMEGIL